MSEDIKQAMPLVMKIIAKVQNTIAPLEREMRLAGWRPEYRVIALNALIAHAQALRDAAEKEIKP
jgi:hypothetical protein